jgi:hypothetical protein
MPPAYQKSTTVPPVYRKATTESAVRSRAKRANYVVRKSRSHVISSVNRGKFMLMNIRNCIVLGERFNASLEDIAEYLDR